MGRDKVKGEYHGKGVSKAIANVNGPIAAALVGKDLDLADQAAMDKILLDLDGTDNKEKLGANAILGVSLAVAKAAAAHTKGPLYRHIAKLAGNNSEKLTLPIPVFNVINGGSHAGNKLAMQEFMLFPHGATSFTEAMRMGSETYHHLKALTKKKFGQDATNVGDEGGFAPNILVNSDALDLIVASIEAAGYTGKIGIAMDVAASEFWKADINKYDLDFKNEDAGDLNDEKRYLTPTQLADVYCSFIKEYPVVSIEDPFDQDDWEGYVAFTERVGKDTQTGQIKTGAPCRSERLAK